MIKSFLGKKWYLECQIISFQAWNFEKGRSNLCLLIRDDRHGRILSKLCLATVQSNESSRCPIKIFFSCHKLSSEKSRWSGCTHNKFPCLHSLRLGEGLLELCPKFSAKQVFRKKTGWFPGSHLRSGVSSLQREQQAHLDWHTLYDKFPWVFVSMENLNNDSDFLDLLKPSQAKIKEDCSLHPSLHKVCCHIKCTWKCQCKLCYI